MFDRQGMLWFTITGANMIGRFNPTNGELTFRNSPTSQSAPYVIGVNSKGIPHFVEFGANKIASIDPSQLHDSGMDAAERCLSAARHRH